MNPLYIILILGVAAAIYFLVIKKKKSENNQSNNSAPVIATPVIETENEPDNVEAPVVTPLPGAYSEEDIAHENPPTDNSAPSNSDAVNTNEK